MGGAPRGGEDSQFARLKARVEYLEKTSALLEKRLQNVEASVVFKFLRWLGARLAPFGFRPRAEEVQYAEWALEDALSRNMTPPRSYPASHITIYMDIAAADPAKFSKTLASIAAQRHDNWELLLSNPPSSPCELPANRVRILQSEPAVYSGNLVVVLHPHAMLAPDALEHLLDAAQSGAAAVYGDWDHIDPRGRRHSPRFTPEFSSTLAHTPYWGPCHLAPATAADRSLPDLAAGGTPVRRVARVLAHLQDPPEKIENAAAAPAASTASASIIICSRNPDRMDKCLRALRSTLDSRHEVITVIHSPFGGDVSGMEDIAKRLGATPVRYQGPFHFGEMNRIGVDASHHGLLCLLNDDIFPVTPDWLDRMAAQAGRPDVGVVGALLEYPDRTLQHAGIVVGGWIPPSHIGRGQRDSPLWPWLRMTREVTAVTGACMVLRRAVWDELGGFDPQFPVNYNDVDLCLRAAARNYRVILETNAVLIHEEARTRVAQVRPEERSRFYERWSSRIGAPDPFFNPQLVHEGDSIALPSPWTSIR